MSGYELTEWMAYYQLEPWCEHRADVRSAVIAKTMADIHTKKTSKPLKLIDFMPFAQLAERRMSSYALSAKIKAAFMGMRRGANSVQGMQKGNK